MAALKFGWKKKSLHNLEAGSALKESNKIEQESKPDGREKLAETVDWRTLLKKDKSSNEENNEAKFRRLYDEGVILAEETRYWEAIKRWDGALGINPMNERLHEMKSQVLMELGEIFPAVQSAKRSVHIKPDWGVAHQTLGRAYLNIGELSLALKGFMKAEFHAPNSPELWTEDIKWTLNLIEQEKLRAEMDTMEMDTSLCECNNLKRYTVN